ncbi:MAG TPA: RdgB/HAM1 family non-canonical purine NTP pyrophosphatase [bacterium]|nr:RdgB/HAM1 family non-canonical purine NTP pyrophosphatase [bacterium]
MKIRHFYLASKNQGKLREVREILVGTGLEVIGCPESVAFPEETGKSFEENAREKAEFLYRLLPGEAVAGEDSGLLVPALDGRPGVFSARFAGSSAEDRANIEKLLQEMAGFRQPALRKAKFVAVVVLVWPGGKRTFRGEVEGVITEKPRGQGGFGYDPVFELPHLKKTFAELTLQEKNQYSHRARAFLALGEFLLKMTD